MFASTVASEVDFIEELRLRRWARENFVPVENRSRTWHPIILEEMLRKDEEIDPADVLVTVSSAQ